MFYTQLHGEKKKKKVKLFNIHSIHITTKETNVFSIFKTNVFNILSNILRHNVDMKMYCKIEIPEIREISIWGHPRNQPQTAKPQAPFHLIDGTIFLCRGEIMAFESNSCWAKWSPFLPFTQNSSHTSEMWAN